MEYVKRTLAILALPFKLLLKVLAVFCFLLILGIHFITFALSIIPIYTLQFLEWIIVCPIYYIVTGKKYYEKYNCISEMALDLVFLEKPYYIKSNEPKKVTYSEHIIYGKKYDENSVDGFYESLWDKIMKISLKLKYE